ncbi:hypothetical protein MaudCBS49596_000689 [Microsporum audouinii]
MASPKAHKTTGLLAFPVELQQLVLKSATDIPSLLALTQSCHTLQAAFQDTQSSILHRVLQNELSPQLIHEAWVVMGSSRPGIKRDKKFTLELITHYFDERGQQKHFQWTVQEALAASRFHKIIQFFASDFATRALSIKKDSHNASGKSNIYKPPSPTERLRFQRALYRFELYCNLFDVDPRATRLLFDSEEKYELFWSRLAVWEREQFACAHEYLFRTCIPAYNYFVEYDVYWGEFSREYEYGFSYNNSNIQGYLRRGLNYIYKIAHAQSYEERLPLIDCGLQNECSFLWQGIVYDANLDWPEPFDNIPEEELLWLVNASASCDCDPGPYEAWHWGNPNVDPQIMVQAGNQIPLRKWAYVMWDHDRLLAWDIFSQPFNPFCRKDEKAASSEIERKQRELYRSRAARSKIFLKGGKGYWSENDETKVKWK